MTEIISVRFKNKGKVYYFDPNGVTAGKGDFVVVETAKGLEYAECVAGNHSVDDSQVRSPLRPVVRLATPEDTRRAEANRRAEETAFEVCRAKIKEHGLDMKLVDVEYNFEGNKILFFFTSDGRVDFRDLVKDLAGAFHTRIELRQIGVRDEARMLGGLGICGRNYCCAQFLDDFQPVSIKMAKNQGFSLNPTKISGACGRLMCCLKYEEEAYEELVKNVPKADSFVDTPAGKGSVVDVNLLKSTVRVRLEDTSDAQIRTFRADEITVLGGKAKRAEYLQLKAEGKIVEEKPAAPRLRKNAPPAAEKREEEKPAAEEPKPKRRPEKRRPEKPQKPEAPAKPEPAEETTPEKQPNERRHNNRRRNQPKNQESQPEKQQERKEQPEQQDKPEKSEKQSRPRRFHRRRPNGNKGEKQSGNE